MNNLRAVIIDDEKHCIRTLEWELERLDGIEVVASTVDPEKGIEHIESLKPDVLFLDIEMPKMNGFDLLKRLDKIDFKIVFTTAYDEHAVKAFETHAIAYLLKPVGRVKLQMVVERIQQTIVINADNLDHVLNDIKARLKNNRRVALPVKDGTEFVSSDDILYCKSDSNYTHVILPNGRDLLISKTLKEIELVLLEFNFLRVHKSYLVNPDHIQKYVRTDGGYLVMSNGEAVNIARNKRDEFMNLFSRL